ncbi:response regulator transcription factor [Candidatus Dojkabacteria bacterium]|jgi:DNA-binding response OmpR family regulator|nr:response regulator transcription factor [Candidatus Dojkabacteria bacterium]
MDKNFRVLFVQEEKELAEIMYNYLSTSFKVTCIKNISKLPDILSRSHFHLVILDTRNKYGNCFEACKYIKSNTNSKLILISHKNDIDLKEKCFKAGCDDFLSKPFLPKEMIIRINKLVGVYDAEEKIECKGLLLNKSKKSLTVHNSTILLSPSEYLIVEYMLSNNEMHQTPKLATYLSAQNEKKMTHGALAVLIKRLRYKLNKGTGMEIIKNRYGKGYYLGI